MTTVAVIATTTGAEAVTGSVAVSVAPTWSTATSAKPIGGASQGCAAWDFEGRAGSASCSLVQQTCARALARCAFFSTSIAATSNISVVPRRRCRRHRDRHMLRDTRLLFRSFHPVLSISC